MYLLVFVVAAVAYWYTLIDLKKEEPPRKKSKGEKVAKPGKRAKPGKQEKKSEDSEGLLCYCCWCCCLQLSFCLLAHLY